MAKILIISEDLWYPPNYGDSLRQFHLLRNLYKEHDFVWCSRYRKERTSREKEEGKRFARSEAIYIPRPSLLKTIAHATPRLISRAPTRHAAPIPKHVFNHVRYLTESENFDLIQIEHTKMAEYIKAISPSCKAIKILTIQNLAHIFYKRMANHTKGILKLFYEMESKKYRKYEENIIKGFDAYITVSKDNMDWLNGHGIKENILLAQNGINVDEIPFLSQTQEQNIMFIGSMDYPPNEDAVCYFVKEVMPIVWSKYRNVKFFIVG
ncbi:MAG: hypothetical protein ACTSRZ_18345 [Promethearchaeota archaeon]